MDNTFRARTLIIGVTGHRALSDVALLETAIDRALARIEQDWQGRRDNRRLVLLSALAEGADRLVVSRALARGNFHLHVVLPLPRDAYMKDFANAASRAEFIALLDRGESVTELGRSTTRKEAYEAAGLYVVDNSDVLIAIWDGKVAHGRGGTAECVNAARRRGLPIAWIKAANRNPGTLEAGTIGASQGEIVFERFKPLR